MARTELFVRKQPGGVFTVAREDLTTGELRFIDAATGVNSVSTGVNPDAPLASLAYAGLLANAILTANKNDRAYLMPGHRESIAAAGGITLNVAGVDIIGQGNGDDRPTLTWITLAAASLLISAAGVRLKNLILDLTGVDAVTGGINVTAADVIIEDCLILMADAGGQAVVGVTIGAAAHRFTFRNNLVLCPNAGATHAIYHAGGATDVLIENNYFDGDASTAMINNDTALMLRLRVLNNFFRCSGAAGIGLVAHANTTGFVNGNHTFVTANIAAGGSMSAAAMAVGVNYASEAAHVGVSATLDPAAGGFG
jgi:hypothetical protein